MHIGAKQSIGIFSEKDNVIRDKLAVYKKK